MVIEYERSIETMRGTHVNLPHLSVEEIASIVGTTTDGTALADVPKINAIFQKAMPPISFVVDLRYRQFEDILDELRQFRPVIPYLDPKDQAGHAFPHAVVVRGLDTKKQLILVNDPLDTLRKPSTMPTTTFMKAWEDGYRHMVKLSVGGQKQLDPFLLEKKPMEVLQAARA
jgi:hypothetical protein